MVNLIARSRRLSPFPELDRPSWAAIIARLESCVQCREQDTLSSFQTYAETISGELDELESAPSLASAASLIEMIHQFRQEWLGRDQSSENGSTALAGSGVLEMGWAGEILCYFPARSLATGEAEVSSRGYFDVLDRPPLWSWIASVGRPADGAVEGFEVGILAWVASDDRALARAGCRASAAPSLLSIEDASDAISRQWRDAGGQGRPED